MKWFNKSYIVALAAVLSFSACDYEDDYTPAAAAGADTVYFESPVQEVVFNAASKDIPVVLKRADATAEKTYEIKAVCDSASYFEVPASVTFAAGEAEKTITVKATESLPMNVEVMLELRLDGNASVNAYAQKMPVASLIVLKEDYEVVSHGVYTNQWTGEGCNCVLQYSPTLDTYRFVNPFGTGVNVLFTYDATTHFGTSVSKQLATGFVHPKEGNVYAKPAALNKNGNNVYFDEANKLWKIGHQWVVAAGRFGVRIENTLLAIPAQTTDFGTFLTFEPLTLCPIDLRPVDLTMMDQTERQWLNDYHATVRQRLMPLLSDAADTQWLENQTKEI